VPVIALPTDGAEAASAPPMPCGSIHGSGEADGSGAAVGDAPAQAVSDVVAASRTSNKEYERMHQ
jgi:hypothetical protein